MLDQNQNIDDFDKQFKNRFEQGSAVPPELAWNELQTKFSQIEDEEFDRIVKKKASNGVTPPKKIWEKISKATADKPYKKQGVYWGALVVLLATLIVSNADHRTTVSETKNEATDNQSKVIRSDNNRIANELNSENLSTGNLQKLSTTPHKEGKKNSVAQNSKSKKGIYEDQSNSTKNQENIPISIKESLSRHENSPAKEQQEFFAMQPSEAIEKNAEKDNDEQLTKESALKDDVSSNKQPLPSIFKQSRDSANKFQVSDSLDSNISLKTSSDLKTVSLIDSIAKNTTNFNQQESSISIGLPDTIAKTKKVALMDDISSNKQPLSSAFNKSRDSASNFQANDSLDAKIGLKTNSDLKTGYLVDSISKNSTNFNQKDSSISIALTDTLAKAKKVALTDTTIKENPEAKNNSKNKWMLTAYAVPAIHNHWFGKTTAFNYYFDSVGFSVIKWSFEVGLSYRFKHNLLFGIGAQMNNYNFNYEKTAFGYEEQFPIKSNTENGTVDIQGLFGDAQIINSIGIGVTPESETEECLCEKEINYKEKLQYTAINIPFYMAWTPGSKKIKPLVKLGGELVLITKSTSEVSLTVAEGTSSGQNHAQLKRINFAGSIGFGTQIELTKKLGIHLIPSITYQFFEISKNSASPLTHYSIRLYSGIYYTF